MFVIKICLNFDLQVIFVVDLVYKGMFSRFFMPLFLMSTVKYIMQRLVR